MKQDTGKRTNRDGDLRQMLLERRQQLQEDVSSRIRDARSERKQDVLDEVEHSDAVIHENVSFGLLQMKTETLARIDEALKRLEAGTFGRCFECEAEIAATRLRALPFAVRCTACEGRREQRQARERQGGERRGGASLFPEATGF
jgi:DnaK suppressor protein